MTILRMASFVLPLTVAAFVARKGVWSAALILVIMAVLPVLGLFGQRLDARGRTSAAQLVGAVIVVCVLMMIAIALYSLRVEVDR